METSPRTNGPRRWASRRSIGGRLVAAVLAGLGLALLMTRAINAAADELPSVTYQGDSVTNGDPDTAIARFGLDAAPWMPRVIAEMNAARGNAFAPRQIMLIHNAEGQLYLVLIWGFPLRTWVEFHKVTELGGGRVWLTFVRRIDNGNYQLIASESGTLFPGEAPVVVVVENHGNHECDTELRLIQLKRNTVDITPDWTGLPVRNVADLDSDGTFELITSHGPAYTCTLIYGGIPAVMRRVDEHFRFACADFPGIFQQWLSDLLWDVPPQLPDLLVQFYRESRQALFLAQAGRMEQGIALMRRAYARLSLAAAQALSEDDRIGRLSELRPPDRQLPIIALLQRARDFTGTPCPVTAAYLAVLAEWNAVDTEMATQR